MLQDKSSKGEEGSLSLRFFFVKIGGQFFELL
jgi:hypothetical protein